MTLDITQGVSCDENTHGQVNIKPHSERGIPQFDKYMKKWDNYDHIRLFYANLHFWRYSGVIKLTWTLTASAHIPVLSSLLGGFNPTILVHLVLLNGVLWSALRRSTLLVILEIEVKDVHVQMFTEPLSLCPHLTVQYLLFIISLF